VEIAMYNPGKSFGLFVDNSPFFGFSQNYPQLPTASYMVYQ
jgi:hypothetical protein